MALGTSGSLDTGYYICSFEERSASVFLVIANRDDPITIVRIRTDKKLVNAVEGERVRLSCAVVGDRATWHWLTIIEQSTVECFTERSLSVTKCNFSECSRGL